MDYDKLSAAIINLPCIAPGGYSEHESLIYRFGHRDARHAAAELVNESAATPSPVPADTAELPPLPNDMERLARRLQSFADRMCNDKSLGEKYEGDESELREAIAILRHLASRPAPVAVVPEGMVLVPEKVTQEMYDAMFRTPNFVEFSRFCEDYEQLIAATPSQPDQSAQEVMPPSEVFAYAAKEVEKDLSGAVEIMKGGAA